MHIIPTLLLALVLSASAAAQDAGTRTPAPVRTSDTTSRQIETPQHRAVFPFDADGIYFSNDFDGARLNQVERTGPRAYTITITPENAPINMSPWYAFQVWSARANTEIAVKLVYPQGIRHRYTPLLSIDGVQWAPLDAGSIVEDGKEIVKADAAPRPLSIVMTLKTGVKPLWVAAQELQTSKHVFAWMDDVARKRDDVVSEIGKSAQGRPMKLLTIGNPSGKKSILIIGRQHPPEVTGYLAMQHFVESLSADTDLARTFRKDWTVYVVPLMNPDGVDNGHWRHNAGGIDLNHDWADFNQPETRVVRDFLKQRAAAGDKFYFSIDFHSTWFDIYYTLGNQFTGNMPGLIPQWLNQVQRAIPGYQPRIQQSNRLEPTTVSRNYFLKTYGMESIVYEIGDNTSRALIREKGTVGATALMKLMLERSAP